MIVGHYSGVGVVVLWVVVLVVIEVEAGLSSCWKRKNCGES